MKASKLAISSNLSKAYDRVKPLASEKNSSYLMAILSFATLSFFGVFAIRPTILTAFTLHKDIQDLRVLNQRYENKITDVVRAQSEYEQIRDDIPLIYETLPKTPRFPQLIKTLETIATSSSLRIETLQMDPQPIAPIVDKKGLTDFNVQLKLSGSYQNAYTFLNTLLSNQRLVSIKTMDLTQGEGTDSAQLTIDFSLGSYYEP